MKITFLLTWADAMGGTERAVYTQAEHLAGRHEVEVLSVFRTRTERFFQIDPRVRVRYLVDSTGSVPRPVRPSALDDEQCRALAGSASRLVQPAWESAFHRLADVEVERALRELDTDVLVSTSPALMAVTTTLAPPGVVTVHQEHRPSHLRGATGEPLFQFAPRLDALVVLTERTRAWFAESLRGYGPHLSVIANALPAGYRPKSSRTTRIVTIAGRVVPDKQVDHAIRAFATVADKHPDWVLRVLGEGRHLPDLRRLAEGLRLHDHVQFIGSSAAMAQEWAKSSIALLTSKDGEALPLVLLEAFAAGVPAISYDCQTGPAEIITDGVDGFLVGPGDVDGLAAAMLRLIEDEPLRHAFGAAALRAAQAYQIDRIMAQWEELYQGLLRERGDPARLTAKADRVAAWTAGTGGSGFAPTAPRPERPLAAPDARAAERAIAARVDGLVRSAGRLSVVSDVLTPHEAAEANLRLTAEALERAGVAYWLVRDHGVRARLAVPAGQRAAVLAAMADAFGDEPVYAEIISPAGAVADVTLAALAGSAGATATAGGLRVYRPVVTSSRTLRYGAAYGCDIELWRESADGQALLPLRRTLVGDSVPIAATRHPARIRVGDREYPTFEVLTRTLVADVAFPVDAVYTWVDGGDPVWQAKKAELLQRLGRPPAAAAAADARFRSRDELRYSLRSLSMFAPWVRHIWLVTDEQTPPWLDTDHPKVTVVSHKEIFGDRGALPTFNSHAIETQLHHIDGLAEHFLYLNDDVFLGRPLHPSAFFAPNGVAYHFLSPTAVPPTPVGADDDFNFAAGKNNRALVEAAFGRTLTRAFLHTPHPLRVSVLSEIEQRFPAEVARTAASQLRSPTDIAVPSSLHHYYGYFTGRCAPGALRVSYVDLGDVTQHPKLTQILTTRGFDAFCLNDTHHGSVSGDELARVTRAFLDSYFPVASEFERGSARNRAAARGSA